MIEKSYLGKCGTAKQGILTEKKKSKKPLLPTLTSLCGTWLYRWLQLNVTQRLYCNQRTVPQSSTQFNEDRVIGYLTVLERPVFNLSFSLIQTTSGCLKMLKMLRNILPQYQHVLLQTWGFPWHIWHNFLYEFYCLHIGVRESYIANLERQFTFKYQQTFSMCTWNFLVMYLAQFLQVLKRQSRPQRKQTCKTTQDTSQLQ